MGAAAGSHLLVVVDDAADVLDELADGIVGGYAYQGVCLAEHFGEVGHHLLPEALRAVAALVGNALASVLLALLHGISQIHISLKHLLGDDVQPQRLQGVLHDLWLEVALQSHYLLRFFCHLVLPHALVGVHDGAEHHGVLGQRIRGVELIHIIPRIPECFPEGISLIVLLGYLRGLLIRALLVDEVAETLHEVVVRLDALQHVGICRLEAYGLVIDARTK